MIGAVFLLCFAGFTIMDMECRRIPQAIERSERRTKKPKQLTFSVCVLFNKSFLNGTLFLSVRAFL